jgi:hypothetical protein
MSVYIRKFGSSSYFMGFKDPFIPTLGLPVHSLPFESQQSALDCLPAVLHFDMEVVGEDCRRVDAEAGRLQNAAREWSTQLFHSPTVRN